MGPAAYYQKEVDEGTLLPDHRQAQVVKSFQRLYEDLHQPPPSKWRFFSQPPAVKGIYIYGSVGRGKTHLMDLFYDTLADGIGKRRQHYHDFMQWIHRRLRQLDGVVDPIDHIGRQMAKQIDILCLDEFLVNDIANAMLLAGILKTLHHNRITLVTTSNVRPDDLYKGGLQRAKFAPAIDWINRHMDVLRLDGQKDYRYQKIQDHEHWYFPLNASSGKRLRAFYEEYEPLENQSQDLMINNRQWTVVQSSQHMLWCDFKVLCQDARGVNDYLELARRYKFVLIDNIPQLSADMDDQTRRFINLIDVFYEHQIGMVCRAECHYETLYQGQKMAFEYTRTRSRLAELLRLQPHNF